MEPQSFPLTLVKVFFTRTMVVAVPEYKTAGVSLTMSPENSIDVKPVDGQQGHYAAAMRTMFNKACDPSAPYFIDMECIGIFTAKGAVSAEEAVRDITATAHGVLYGAIREAVSWITGRQAFGQLTLGLAILQPKEPGETR